MNNNETKLRKFTSRIFGGDPLPRLIAEMRDLRDEGISAQDVLSFLKNLRANCPDDHKEDVVLELMDIVTGYCAKDQCVWMEESKE